MQSTTSVPKGPVSERRDEVEGRILAACEGLLEQRPFAQISIEDLAQAAGIQRTAFYFYFANKQDVLARLIKEIADALYTEAQEWLAQPSPTTADIEQPLEDIVSVFAEHRTLLRAAVEVSTYVPEMGEFWRALVDRFVDAAEERIRRDQAAGSVHQDLDPRKTAEALVWMAERCCYQFLAVENDREPKELAKTLAQVWGYSLLKSPQGS